MEDISQIIERQRAYFFWNETKDVDFRLKQLRKLKQVLKSNEDLLYEAIYADFGKSRYETYLTELSQVYHEINVLLKHLKKWSRRKKVRTNLGNFPGKSYIVSEPLGNVLVIGAWNYPYGLSLIPVLSAIGAGNTVILKPSEVPSRTAQVMADLINTNFDAAFFYVYQGGVEKTTALLKHRFDKIFFTGSTPVGKIIYQAAAEHLTPVTLELGGKSPTFVLADCDIKMTAKRLVWAKFLNAGQTCVAPDYVLVEKAIEQVFLQAIQDEITTNYQNENGIRENYLKIINTRNYDRLFKLIDQEKVFCGGTGSRDLRYIQPTVLHGVNFEDRIMQDEIFGPILPVIAFEDLDEAIQAVKMRPKPLSCYVYGKDKTRIQQLVHEISFGGGAINDSIMHLSNSHLPFGGVGFSGMGSYHGKAGFDTFSHAKSMLYKRNWFEPSLKYYPYTVKKLKWLKRIVE